jgi:DMSO/TMAO reductase YedYZ molybdopterin-dependent catalytic subunit
MQLTRRDFLVRGARVGALGWALAAVPAWAREAAAAGLAGDPALIERNAWPEHWETTVAALGRGALTPNDAFFVRSHFGVPAVDPAAWRLAVRGLVQTPLALDLGALRALPQRTVRATVECAGNGRGLFRLANTSGTQWELGAVGNAEWAGVPLAALLERAGVASEARHVWFEAADHATLPQAPPFLRSIPIELARERALVVTTMNGVALPGLHGGPARMIVPGWYGMAWAKWVTGIRVEAAPSDNHFMIRGYRFVAPGGDPLASPPVEAMRVKSLITSPLDGARISGKALDVSGWAWTGQGDGTVRRVEVSADGGTTWIDATLEAQAAPFAWRGFRARVTPAARGASTLVARATDSTGERQPLSAAPNTGGYGNNSAHRVTVHA